MSIKKIGREYLSRHGYNINKHINITNSAHIGVKRKTPNKIFLGFLLLEVDFIFFKLFSLWFYTRLFAPE